MSAGESTWQKFSETVCDAKIWQQVKLKNYFIMIHSTTVHGLEARLMIEKDET